MAETYRVLVTASRDWLEPLQIWDALDECRYAALEQGRALVVVHGDAPGGDQIAKLYGQVVAGCEHQPHQADWEGPCRDECKAGHRRKDRRGRDYCPAGMYRNSRMIALGADRAAAFIREASAGASGCARLAEKAGIPTRRYLA